MPREVSSNGPWGYNAGLDSVVGPPVFGVVRNFGVSSALHLRASLLGAAPSYGELHLCYPTGARSWRSLDDSFWAHQMLPTEDVEAVSGCLCDQWEAVARELDAATHTTQFEFATGRPIRLHVGGVGGFGFLGMRAAPILYSLWRAGTCQMITTQYACIDMVDACCVGQEGLSPYLLVGQDARSLRLLVATRLCAPREIRPVSVSTIGSRSTKCGRVTPPSPR